MAVVFSVFSWLAIPPGEARAAPESVRIDYTAPVGCPTPNAFLRSVRERTNRFHPASPEEPARHFSVSVTIAGPAVLGQLEIHGPDGIAVRSVEGRSCSDVAEALALMTALAIDPSALGSGTQPASIDADTRREPPAPPPAQHDAERAPIESWRWLAGLQGHLAFRLSPDTGAGGSLFVETEKRAPASPGAAIRAGIFFNQSSADLSTPAGATARFQWAAAALEGCPFGAGFAGHAVAIYPCVALRLGVLRSEGQGISHPKRATNLWSDVGPVVRLRVAATSRLLFEAQGALLFPLTRPEFDVLDVGSQTSAKAFTIPRWGGLVGLGVAYRIR
jgi:hypothetical protein